LFDSPNYKIYLLCDNEPHELLFCENAYIKILNRIVYKLLVCEQTQFLEYMWDIFSFDQVRYTTVEHLAEDIMQLARSRSVLTASRLADMTAL